MPFDLVPRGPVDGLFVQGLPQRIGFDEIPLQETLRKLLHHRVVGVGMGGFRIGSARLPKTSINAYRVSSANASSVSLARYSRSVCCKDDRDPPATAQRPISSLHPMG